MVNFKYKQERQHNMNTEVKIIKHDAETGEYWMARVKEDGTYISDFKVMGFADLHIAGVDNKDVVTLEYMMKNVKAENPDLILLLGDMPLTWFNYGRTKNISETLENTGVYWSPILGNHEGESGPILTRKETMQVYTEYNHCLASVKLEGVDGYGNQAIHVMSAPDKVSHTLFLMDSGGGSTWESVRDSQVKWYESIVKRRQDEDPNAKSSVFLHIPLRKFKEIYKSAENPENRHLWGVHFEEICIAAGDNNNLYDKVVELGSTVMFVFGHDHLNDFAIENDGKLFMYNQPGGYSCYDIFRRGIRRDGYVFTEKDRLQGCTIYYMHDNGTIDIEQSFNTRFEIDI